MVARDSGRYDICAYLVGTPIASRQPCTRWWYDVSAYYQQYALANSECILSVVSDYTFNTFSCSEIPNMTTNNIISVNPVAEIVDAKHVNAAIKQVGAASRQLENMIQQVAVQCVFHSHVYGNVDMAKNLLETVKNKNKSGVRYNALKEYLIFFGAIRQDKDKSWKLDRKKRVEGLMYDSKLVGQILSTNWIAFKHKDEGEEVTPFTAVSKSIARFTKAADAGKKLHFESSASSDIDNAIAELMKLKMAIAEREAIRANNK